MYFYEWALSQELHYSWRMEFIMMSLGRSEPKQSEASSGVFRKKSVYCNTHIAQIILKKVSFG